MDNNKRCEIIFYDYKKVAEDWKSVSNLISHLSDIVQNPDYMCIKDLEIYKEQCKVVSMYMSETIDRTKIELNKLYRDVLEVYREKLGE